MDISLIVTMLEINRQGRRRTLRANEEEEKQILTMSRSESGVAGRD
jgi:hypothetical protein